MQPHSGCGNQYPIVPGTNPALQTWNGQAFVVADGSAQNRISLPFLQVNSGAATYVVGADNNGVWSYYSPNLSPTLAGGSAGQVPWQISTNVTGFTATGTSGQLLQSGATNSPTWITPNNLLVTSTGSTTARTLANRFADVVNVKDFGAIGDGVTDDTAAIQAAVNAAPLIGGTVFFPNGTYKFSGVTITKGISLIGEGYQDSATHFINPSATAPFFSFSNATGIKVSNFKASSSVTRTGGAFLSFNTTSRVKISDFYMSGYYTGIIVDFSDNIVIDSFSMFNGIHTAIQVGKNARVENCAINNGYIKNETTAATYGVFAGYVDVFSIGSGLIIINHGTCFQIAPTAGQTASLIDCYGSVFDTATNGVVILPNGGSVIRADFVGVWCGVHSNAGMTINSTLGQITSIRVAGGDFTVCGFGINCEGLNSLEVIISGAQISGNGVGVRLQSCGGVSIDSCNIGGGGQESINTLGFITTTNSNGALQNNTFGTNTTNVSGLSSAPNVLAYGNIGIDNQKPYTPTVSSVSGSLTTVSATGNYQISPNSISFTAVITVTTNGTGAGGIAVTLPNISAISFAGVGRATINSGKALQVIGSSSSNTVYVYNYDGTYPASNGEQLVISGEYSY